MKILHVESGKHFYGGARQVAYIIKGLSGLGVSNILACPIGADIAREVSQYAQVYEMPMKGDADIGLVSRLTAVIRSDKPDIVHLHSRRGADIWGGIAAKLTQTPCILSRRVDNPESRLLVSMKYRLYDHVITISEAIRQVLLSEGVPPEKVTCVRSAVDPAPYLHAVDRTAMRQEFSLPDNAIVIGIVAQLIPRKGHAYLIEAIKTLSREYPHLRVLCFGQGPLRSQLESAVQQKNLSDIIQFTGFRTDLPKWLGGLDILAHPADMEGLGVSLLQASAAAVPIITTRAGGLPEAVLENATGILIEPGDTHALTAALKLLIDDADLRHTLGSAGRKRIMTDFSVETMTLGNLDVYRKVLNHSN
ncbi:glycosyltransferase [Oxalobacter vibrioformis]|uniref:Glycosyltransferase n=1 Tax=Oxalobacter vibrioformis TaxID=933080 RepID=A0A9E9P335_9BURK|nr:glycosyltransferase [Oxalobacter vibrioformis]WAW10587.1 glycosyltransferase [Oxalobacter vibrioformis]